MLGQRNASTTSQGSGWSEPHGAGVHATLPLLLPPAASRHGSGALSSSDEEGQQQPQQPQQPQQQRQQPRQGGGAGADAAHILAIAGPLCLEGVAAMAENILATAVVGRCSDSGALAALVLAQSLYAVSGYSLVSGLASALETLSGQAYGAGARHLMPASLLRCQLVCGAAVLPSLALYASGGLARLLPAAGQPPALAALAARLLRVMAPALPLAVLSESVAQHLLAQSRALPILASSLVGLAAAGPLNWALVCAPRSAAAWGVLGAGAAAVAIQGLLAAQLLAFLAAAEWWGAPARAAAGWSSLRVRDALRGVPAYLRFALPCLAAVALEWWMWEVMVLMAAALPDADVATATTGIATQLQSLPWVVNFGLGTAASTRVAQALGAGQPRRAASLFRTACLLVLAVSGVMCGAMWVCQRGLAAAFSSSPAVQRDLVRVLPIVVATVLLDGQAAVTSGVLRGAGRQAFSASVAYGSYWVVGLPLAWALAFRAKLGVVGLRLALAAAVAVQALALHAYVACSMSFDDEAARAKALVADADAAAHAPLLEGRRGDDGADATVDVAT